MHRLRRFIFSLIRFVVLGTLLVALSSLLFTLVLYALLYFCFQLEKQLKELMEERDTVQSQLNCLLKGDGDDHGNEHTAKRWVFVLSHIPTSL